LRRNLARIVAAVIVAVGIIGVGIPDTLITIRTDVVSPASIYIEATFKIAVGLALALAAPHSRAAGTLRCIGAVAAFGGLAIPIFGVEGARERLAWESAHITFFRFEAALFVLLGAIILSAVSPRHPINDHQLSETDGEL
jgi:hypothetical protein